MKVFLATAWTPSGRMPSCHMRRRSCRLTQIPTGTPCTPSTSPTPPVDSSLCIPTKTGAQPLQVTHKHAQKGGPALQGFRKTHKRQHFRVVPWEKRTGHSKRSSWLCRAERRHTILRMPPKESTPPKKGTRGKVDAAIEKN